MFFTKAGKNRRRVVPQVESLENRQLLSATVHFASGVLSITGSNQADRIQINDSGARVSVFDGNVFKGSFAHVNAIRVNTFGGNDTVTYNVLGTSPLHINDAGNHPINRRLLGNLGSGNDFFQTNVVQSLRSPRFLPSALESLGGHSHLDIQMQGGDGNDAAQFRANVIGANSNLNFRFDGGNGADAFNAVFGEPFAAEQANDVVRLTFFGGNGNDAAFVHVIGDLPSNAQTFIDLHGQAGNDSLFAHYDDGILNDFMRINVDGGPGNDRVIVDVEMRNFSNLGQLQAFVNGGPGNDNLTLLVRKENPQNATQVDAIVSGGAGRDTATFTHNVAIGAGVEVLNEVQ